MDSKLSSSPGRLSIVDLNPHPSVAEMPPVATLPAAPESQSQSQSGSIDNLEIFESVDWMEEEDQLASDSLDGGGHEGAVCVTAFNLYSTFTSFSLSLAWTCQST